MKRFLMVIVVTLAVAGLAAAQGGSKPAPQQGQKDGITLPGAQPQQQLPQQPQPRRPQAKSQEEYQAFMAVMNNTDLAAAEIQAREFEVKYPQSELKGVVFEKLMTQAQEANNADKLIEFGRRSLEHTPDRAPVLILVATVLSERMRDTDIDRDEKIADTLKLAQKGLANVDATAIPPGITAEQAATAKSELRAMAHSAMGLAEYTRKNNAAAEQHFKDSLQVPGSTPDAVTYFRLALAQDHQNKYAEALQSAEKAVQLANPQDAATPAMVAERDRLKKLAGPATTATPPPQKPQ